MRSTTGGNGAFFDQLKRYYTLYTGGFIVFLVLLAIFEKLGLQKVWIGYIFLFATIALYAVIGIMSRTADVSEYYVAGRRVPALFNGMATGADWMSAASFIGLAGGLYLQGFDGHAFILGWTGGYCLVAFLLAPYLRKFGQFTIPDFLGARYGGNAVRLVGVMAAILCSFVYVVAQIYGVGLITSRFTGVEFGVGVFLGLAGILVCSFLGGMRAVTWTQVAQYIVLVIAYMIPVIWLSVKHTNIPIPQLVYGTVLEKLEVREKELTNDPMELDARSKFQERADTLKARIANLPASWDQERNAEIRKLEDKKAARAPAASIRQSERAVAEFPKTVDEARKVWTAQMNANQNRAAPPMPHATPFYSNAADPARRQAESDVKRLNFMALVFCLMVGTAALPHILMRYYTTPSVAQARESVFWSLLFIFILYVTAPALAVLVKFDIYTMIVGKQFADLPAWVAAWTKVDPNLLSIVDINNDGKVQLAEIRIGQDIVVLATPEIAGLPYVVSGLVAAGGLAAALSTADGLLLTISNALSHDTYYKMINPNASTQKRVMISKVLLLAVALVAAYVTLLRPGDILFMVGAAFSLAASSFFPALVLGVFWKRANQAGALVGMIAGFCTCAWYMGTRYEFFQKTFGLNAADWPLWFGILPISSGVFGVPAGFLALVLVSLVTPAPSRAVQEFVDNVRFPRMQA